MRKSSWRRRRHSVFSPVSTRSISPFSTGSSPKAATPAAALSACDAGNSLRLRVAIGQSIEKDDDIVDLAWRQNGPITGAAAERGLPFFFFRGTPREVPQLQQCARG